MNCAVRKSGGRAFPAAAMLLCGLFSAFAAVGGETDLAPAAFLERARRPNQVDTWAMLSGRLQHRREGGKAESMSIYFGIIIQKDRSTGQLVFDGREGYLLGQARDRKGASVIPMQKSTTLIDHTGVRASDLTLDFLYYDLVREDREEKLGGYVACRVMVLSSPDKAEQVRVFLSKTYYFPLRAEFFRAGEKEPWRILETGGFTRRNDLYYVRRLLIEGPGWRTRIDFNEAELGLYKPETAPKNLIRKLSGK